jgi:PKD domain/S-layer homology domain
MLKSLRLISYLALIVSSLGTIFAGEMPYTDVAPSAPYASAVQELYDGRIITDDGSHLFRPTDLMARDFFVSLAVGIGCHECMSPSVDDIIRYRVSPFVDLPKVNQYYYCIAYAKEYDITQGYIMNERGESTCENSQIYTSSPFCASNTITRIEAAAILLRRAKLWDDILNSTSFDSNTQIPDVTSYWYGYAKKGIEIGIITPQSDGKIGQDEKITRGEFAIMAARILKYTQCKIDTKTSTVPVEIVIRDMSGKIVPKTVFSQGSTESLSTINGTGAWDKIWTLRNPTTGETLSGTSDTYPIWGLSCGTWINIVDLIDRSTRQVVSSASNTITIECSNQQTSSSLSVGITANPLSTIIGNPIDFAAIVSEGSGILNYRWEYGDGMTSTSSGSTTHSYRDNGTYIVSLTITDASGNTATSNIVIYITGDRDTDRDGMIDTIDQCPLVYAQTSSGCPRIAIYIPGNNIASWSLWSGISSTGNEQSLFGINTCLQKKSKSQWLLIGTPNCTQCPCSNTISINSSLRSCDIVFPTILSPSLDNIYSRGGFYLIL